MQFNQKLIKQLAAGEIALDACLNKEMAESILKETGLPVRNEHKHRYYYRNALSTIVNNGVHYELKAVPIFDFLLPEPRFKVGDQVIVTDHPLITKAEIKEAKQHPDTGNWAYMVSDGMAGCFVSEELLLPVPEPKFIVGDKVLVRGKSEQTITEIKWCDHFQSGKGGWSYIIGALNGIGYGESLLQPVPSPTGTPKFKVGDRVIHKKSTGNNSFIVHHISWCADLKDFCCYPEKGIGLAEFALVHAPDPVQDPIFETDFDKYIIGNAYEFKIEGVLPWEKGVLMAIIDDKDKYIVRRNNGTIVAFPDIRHIPPTPVKIERWAMYSQKSDTFFGKPCKSFNDCEIAYKHAPLDFNPIKLEGTYYVDPD